MLPPPQTGLEKRRSSLIQAYNRPPAPNPVWTGGVQPQEKSRFGAVAAFGGTIAGITALGFAPVGKKRMWDHYLKAIRAAEEVSPARIFRTFQYSELLSPLGGNRAFDFPAELFNYTYEKAGQTVTAPNRAMRRFVSNMLDKPIAELEELGAFKKGLEFRRTGWMFGELSVKGGKLLSNAALPMKAGTHAGGSFIDWYARLTGVGLDITEGVTRTSSGGMMAVTVPKVDKVLGIPISSIAQVHLQKARVTGRIARAYMAGQIGRLNRLLAAPADWFPSVGKLMKKMGIGFTVNTGSALQMLGRYTAKGLAIAGAYKGFQHLSYLRGESDNKLLSGAGFAILGGALGGIFRQTRRGVAIGAAIGALVGTAPLFDKGVIEGAATAYTRIAMGHAKVSESTGLTASRREQEEFMPGITKARTLLGFTTGGLMTGLLAGYGLKVAKFRQLGIEGANEFMKKQGEAIKARSAAIKTGQPGLIGRTKAWFGRKTGAGAKGLQGRALMRGGWAGALLGAASFGALAIGAAWATGNALPGILGSEHTPEELERLYTGREDVAIRRGRWWEFGRCLTKSNTYKLYDGTIKTSEEIKIGDVLVGRDYKKAKVLNIYTRHHKGLVYRLSSAYDRDNITEVTGNHIIPIRSALGTIEIEADKINVNDWIEVPYEKLNNNINTIDATNIIGEPIWVLKDKVYSVQQNWYTKKPQRSGSCSIDKTITLDYDLGLLFGYFLAEGNIGFRGGKANLIETVHAKSEYNYVLDIERIVYEKFNTQITKRFKTTGKLTKEGCWIVRICNGILAKLFRHLFYPKEYKAAAKQIPDSFLNTNADFKEGLIEGYWRGDGHLDGDTRIITSARKHLLQSVQKIAINLNQPCGISVHSSGEFNSWRLRFTNKNGSNIPVEFVGDRLFARVRSIEIENYDNIVYDFTVETNDHLFQAGTFLVHNSPWEGGRIAYYRPHWYRMLMSKAKIKGLWGGEEKKWEASPVIHPLKALFDKEFQYRWERENYYERPYPMAGTYGSSVPFITPLTEAIGQLIKPSKLMHTDEWLRGQGLESAIAGQGAVLQIPTAGSHEPAYDLDGLRAGTPVSKFESKQQLGEFMYRMNELRGLTGFLHGAVKESLTGSQDYFDEMEQLETASRAYGAERAYWDKELGGLLGMCFVAETPIKTSDGIKNIEDVCAGDIVLSKGMYRKVLHHLQRVTDKGKKMITISAQSAGVNITCTDNHWIPILRRRAYKSGHKKPFNSKNISMLEVQAKDIQEGDYLLYQIDKSEKEYIIDLCGTGRCSTSKYVYKRASQEYAKAYETIESDATSIFPHGVTRAQLRNLGFKDSIAKEAFYSYWHEIKPDRINRYIPLTEDIAYVIGWYIAEGCQDGTKLTYTMHANEKIHAEKILNVFKVLGFNGKIKVKDNTLVLRIYSSQLARYFSIFGDGAHNKCIPVEFKQLPAQQLEKLIEGLILGDGWDKGFTSVSRQLTKDLFDCLLKLGQHANLFLDYTEKGKGFYPQGTERHSSKRHYLRLTDGRYSWRFLDEETYLVPVSQIDTSISIGETVYDLTIEDIHYYTADSVLVHNTEAFRRFLPHRRRQIQLYNPIKNLMPEWLPGPNYYVDFQHGDPFVKVQEGDIRLPGKGYAALNPSVAGLDPEDYPLEHRFKILADVAMYSNQFKAVRREMRGAMRRGELSGPQIELFNRVNHQVSEKKKRKRFNEYRFTEDVLEKKSVTVADILPGGLIQTKEQGIIGFGGVNIREEKGTETYRRKQAQVSDFLREHVQPGAELDVFVHRDPLHRFKKSEAGYYQPAIIESKGQNLSEKLVDADIMRFSGGKDPFAIRSKYNVAQRMLGGFWEKLAHYESPREYLLPLSPKAKFLHQRSAIEEYERSRVWGTESAFWQHPVKHFIEPTMGMAAREWGETEEIPERVQKRRSIEGYFDKLKWVKYKALERAAINMDDDEAAKEFKAQQRRTIFGVNPYGSQSYIYSAMPSLDRDYYEEFKGAQTQEERATIMKMIAPSQRKLYLAQWRNQLFQALKAKQFMKITDESTEAVLGSLNAYRFAEGRDISPQLQDQYKEEALSGETYADWSRRKEVSSYFKEEASLPGPNWAGWHPHVDLEDVKLKIVDNLGEDIHDYNLWESRQRELVRKPYITEEPLTAETKHPSELAKAIEGTLRDVLKLKNVQVQVIPAPAGQDEVQLEIADSRKTALQKYKANPEFQEMI